MNGSVVTDLVDLQHQGKQTSNDDERNNHDDKCDIDSTKSTINATSMVIEDLNLNIVP